MYYLLKQITYFITALLMPLYKPLHLADREQPCQLFTNSMAPVCWFALLTA